MTLERSRIIRKVRSASPSSFQANRSPMPWVPRKYSSIRKMTTKMNDQKNSPTKASTPHLKRCPSSLLVRWSFDRIFGRSSQRIPGPRKVVSFTSVPFPKFASHQEGRGAVGSRRDDAA